MNPYHHVPTVLPTNNGEKLKAEFARVCAAVVDATGIRPSAAHSFRDASGLWECRDARSDLIAEVAGDSVTVVQSAPAGPAVGLLDRIRDLRRSGLSSAAVLGWFGERRAPDPVGEAALCVRLALHVHGSAPTVLALAKAPVATSRPPIDDPWRLAR